MDNKSLLDSWKERGIVKDKRLLKAFLSVPREFFVKDVATEDVYEDRPKPIGEGQTISQPTTVIIMTEALEVKAGQKILEVGAGSGWQAAILGKIAGKKGKVYSLEIIPSLADFARENLEKANIGNVVVMAGDGGKGYGKEAPYDRILVTAACPRIPMDLIDQLQDPGILVAPVGGMNDSQKMVKLRKNNGKITKETLGDFSFVPLRGEFGFS